MFDRRNALFVSFAWIVEGKSTSDHVNDLVFVDKCSAPMDHKDENQGSDQWLCARGVDSSSRPAAGSEI